MPEYVNPNPHAVHLQGPDGRNIRIMSKQRIYLDEYFERYVSRGFLKRVDSKNAETIRKNIQARISLNPIKKDKPALPNRAQQRILQPQKPQTIKQAPAAKRNIVGRALQIDSHNILIENIENDYYPISNNIGIGILSYNRKNSLERLIQSIIKYTDLRRTTVFISDDASNDIQTIEYIKQLKLSKKFTVLMNDHNIGVAGNSNRLLRCLSRFSHSLLLNDDVEILEKGWEYFYQKATRDTGIQHFQYRQYGIYGAQLGTVQKIGQFDIRVIDDKPHGAILSLTSDMLQTCGYFNNIYGKYGLEHVDWSMKPSEFGLQPKGFYDVEGSSRYFKIHNEETSVGDKEKYLKRAREIFSNRIPKQYIHPGEETKVESIGYVIPVRNIDRQESINTVIDNIRGQRFANIQIIIVEQDEKSNITLNNIMPVEYYLSENNGDNKFNKSQAFNYGVNKVMYDRVILHDADMLVVSSYTNDIYDILNNYQSCHIGSTVTYTTQQSKDDINTRKVVDNLIKMDRTIGYYEGGSLACTVETYWNVGAFNEDYKGYGNEDCDFYYRLTKASKCYLNRTYNLLHLWHGRTDGWEKHHAANKIIEQSLRKLTVEQRVSLQHEQLKKNGYGKNRNEND